jgi:hypothetical protein
MSKSFLTLTQSNAYHQQVRDTIRYFNQTPENAVVYHCNTSKGTSCKCHWLATTAAGALNGRILCKLIWNNCDGQSPYLRVFN